MSTSIYHSSPQKYQPNDQNNPPFFVILLVIISIFVLLCLAPICVCIRCCCRRRGSRRPDTQPDNTRVLAALDLVYGARTTLSSPSSGDDQNCSICLDEYGNQDSVRVLTRCGHMFHKHCIDEWLPGRSLNCPVCRDPTLQIIDSNF